MNEIQEQYQGGLTLYALLFTADGLVWNGTSFVVLSPSDWPACAIPAPEQTGTVNGIVVGTGIYYCSVPANVPPGTYGYAVRLQVGSAPQPGDTGIDGATGTLVWPGIAPTPVAPAPNTVTLRFTLYLPDPATGLKVPTDPLPGVDGTLATAVTLASPGLQRVDVSPAQVVQASPSYFARLGAGDYALTYAPAVAGGTYSATAAYNYSAGGYVLSGTTVVSETVGVIVQQATGRIISQQTLSDWLGSNNLYILADQDQNPNGTAGYNVPRIQQAINRAEARATARLIVLRSASSTFFKSPLTVGGLPPLLADGSLAQGLLQPICHQYAGQQLREWRLIASDAASANDATSAILPIDVRVRNWTKRADADLDLIVRWTWGYSDGLAIDIDLAADAVLGAPAKQVVFPEQGDRRIDGLSYGIGYGLGW